MRSLIICDRSFAQREHAMLRRLEVGLVDEGVIVTRAVPQSCLRLLEGGLSAGIGYAETGWSLLRGFRANAVIQKLQGDNSPAGDTLARTPVDIVHAWGEQCWPLAIDVACELGASIALEVWSNASLDRMKDTERHARNLTQNDCRGEWFAADSLIADALRSRRAAWTIHDIPWGVHLPAEPIAPSLEHGRASAIGIIWREQVDTASGVGLLTALADESLGDTVIFIDSAAVDAQPELWRTADRLGLLDRLSVLDTLESHRDLILKVDVLALPDPAGEHRSIMLDAMAQGVAVVTSPDPLIADAIHDRTAVLVDSPEGWKAALSRVLQPAERHRLVASARAYISQNRLAHQHVRRVLDAYTALAPEPIAFRGLDT